ncbi:hypothetical protein SUNI508_05761 [Seiridium unicorne]|uniref:Uncharacterized protein n=1 Tax=Seiridium unicorne TaxID=138068 RepID=A0ABR2V4T0_9PEZI
MNWTEGNLARHSRGRANNQILKRQKQHFAKARTKLLGGNVRRSPVSISFLPPEQVLLFRDGSANPPSQTGVPSIPRPGFAHPRAQISPSSSKSRTPSRRADHHGPSHETTLDRGIGHFPGARKRPILADIVNEENAQEKRRKLLMKPDWAGLEMQKPIDLVFPGQIQASTRRLWNRTENDRQRSIFRSQQTRHIPRTGINKSPRHEVDHSKITDISPIRVRIGSQSIAHATDSASQLSTRLSPMSKSDLLIRHLHKPSGPSSSRYYERFEPSVLPSRNEIRQKANGHSLKLAEHSHSHPDQPGRNDFTTPEIFEPIPRRTEVPAILHRSPSSRLNDSESIRAEVGRPKRRPLSETADNEQWMNSLMSPENLVIPLTRGSSLLESSPYQPNISPGISEAQSLVGSSIIDEPEASTAEYSSSLIGRATSQAKILGPSRTSAVTMYHRPIDVPTVAQPDVPYSTSRNPTPECRQTERESRQPIPATEKCRGKPTGTWSSLNSAHPEQQAMGHTVTAERADLFSLPADDDNAKWMQFIFGDSGDRIQNEVFKEAAHDAARAFKPSGSPESSADMPTTDETCLGASHFRARSAGSSQNSEESSEHIVSSDCANASHAATKGTKSSPVDYLMEPGHLQNGGMDMEASESPSINMHKNARSSSSQICVMATSDSDQPASDPESDEATAGGSEVSTIFQPSFKFALPQTFVGKLAGSKVNLENMPPPPLPILHRAKGGKLTRGGKGLRRKKHYDGRTDIRALPDFDGDPIEE